MFFKWHTGMGSKGDGFNSRDGSKSSSLDSSMKDASTGGTTSYLGSTNKSSTRLLGNTSPNILISGNGETCTRVFLMTTKVGWVIPSSLE